MPAINLRQALVPSGAAVVLNPNGTAPGLWLEDDDRVIVLLPGPPRELKPMIESIARERLSGRAGPARVITRVLRIAGQGESHAEEVARPFFALWRSEGRGIEATTLAAPGSIDFHLSIRSEDAAVGSARLDAAIRELAQAFGEDAYADDESSMEAVVGMLLRDRRYTVAAAESCTGGLLTSRLTDVPGSSAYVQLSIVAYSNAAKTALLGVPAALIATHGAVSEPVAVSPWPKACECARAARSALASRALRGPTVARRKSRLARSRLRSTARGVLTSAPGRCSAAGSTSSSGPHRPPSTTSAGCCSVSGGESVAAAC